MANTTYESGIQLDLGQVPLEITDQVLYQELLDLHNAIEALAMGNLENTSFPIGPQFIGPAKASSALAVTANAGDRDLVLTDATGFSLGDSISDLDLASNRKLPQVVAIAGNTLTLDRFIDGTYPAGVVAVAVPVELNVVGSPANPIIYRVKPPAGAVWHITRVLLAMTHNIKGDMGLFGGLSALEYGLQGRVLKGGQTFSYTNWKINADLALSMYDVRFDDRSGGQGDFGTSGRFTFTNAGTLISLDGTQGDEMQLMIQDDLSGLVSFEVSAQGHLG